MKSRENLYNAAGILDEPTQTQLGSRTEVGPAELDAFALIFENDKNAFIDYQSTSSSQQKYQIIFSAKYLVTKPQHAGLIYLLAYFLDHPNCEMYLWQGNEHNFSAAIPINNIVELLTKNELTVIASEAEIKNELNRQGLTLNKVIILDHNNLLNLLMLHNDYTYGKISQTHLQFKAPFDLEAIENLSAAIDFQNKWFISIDNPDQACLQYLKNSQQIANIHFKINSQIELDQLIQEMSQHSGLNAITIKTTHPHLVLLLKDDFCMELTVEMPHGKLQIESTAPNVGKLKTITNVNYDGVLDEIAIESSSLQSLILRSLPEKFPIDPSVFQLHTNHLNNIQINSLLKPINPRVLLTSLPNLKELRINSQHFTPEFYQYQDLPPLTNIKTIILGDVTLNQLDFLAKVFPNIEDLTLHLSSQQTWDHIKKWPLKKIMVDCRFDSLDIIELLAAIPDNITEININARTAKAKVIQLAKFKQLESFSTSIPYNYIDCRGASKLKNITSPRNESLLMDQSNLSLTSVVLYEAKYYAPIIKSLLRQQHTVLLRAIPTSQQAFPKAYIYDWSIILKENTVYCPSAIKISILSSTGTDLILIATNIEFSNPTCVQSLTIQHNLKGTLDLSKLINLRELSIATVHALNVILPTSKIMLRLKLSEKITIANPEILQHYQNLRELKTHANIFLKHAIAREFKYISELMLYGDAEQLNSVLATNNFPRLYILQLSNNHQNNNFSSWLINGEELKKLNQIAVINITTNVASLKIENISIKQQLNINVHNHATKEINLKNCNFNLLLVTFPSIKTTISDCQINLCMFQDYISTLPSQLQNIEIVQSDLKHLSISGKYAYHLNLLRGRIELLSAEPNVKQIDFVMSHEFNISTIHYHRSDTQLILPPMNSSVIYDLSQNEIIQASNIPDNSTALSQFQFTNKAVSFKLMNQTIPNADTGPQDSKDYSSPSYCQIYSHPSVPIHFYRVQVTRNIHYTRATGDLIFNYEPDKNKLEWYPLSQFLYEEKTDTKQTLCSMVGRNHQLVLTYMNHSFENKQLVPIITESPLLSPAHLAGIYIKHCKNYKNHGFIGFNKENCQAFLYFEKLPQATTIELLILYKKDEWKFDHKTMPKLEDKKQNLLWKDLNNYFSKVPANKLLSKLLKKLNQANLSAADKIHELIEYCSKFEPKTLSALHSATFTPLGALLESMSSKSGACGHRSEAFFLLCWYYNLPCLLIKNQLHELVATVLNPEAKEAVWTMQNLGGATVARLIDKHNSANLFDQLPQYSKKLVVPTSTYPGMFENTFITNSKFYVLYQNIIKSILTPRVINQFAILQEELAKNPLLVLFEHEEELKRFAHYIYIKKLLGSTYYIHTPTEFYKFLFASKISQDQPVNYLGPLADFLKNPGTLIVNWTKFTAQDLTFYQSILEEPGNLYGFSFTNIKIMGLALNQTSFVESESSLSRQQEVIIEQSLLAEITTSASSKNSSPILKPVTVNLFSSLTYKEDLFFQIKFNQQTVKCIKQAFFKAVETASPLLIYNPPNQPELLDTLERIEITQEAFLNGETISLPSTTTISTNKITSPTTHDRVRLYTQLDEVNDRTPIFISMNEWHQLFTNILYTEAGPITLPGLLAQFDSNQNYFLLQGKILINQWEKLIFKISDYPDKLFHFYLSPGAEIENVMVGEPLSKPSYPSVSIPPEQILNHSIPVVVSNDPDYYVDSVKRARPEIEIVYLNKHTSSTDLIFESRIIKSENGKKTFRNEYKKTFLALKTGKTLVLTGPLALALYQTFYPLLLGHHSLLVNTKAEHITGRLLIVLSKAQAEQLPLTNTVNYDFTADDYLLALDEKHHELATQIFDFYKIAQQMSLAGAGRPPHLNLSYQHLQLAIHALHLNLSSHNPIKHVFHYDFPKQGEDYAYLCVLAKWIFAKNDDSLANYARLKQLLSHVEPEFLPTLIQEQPWKLLNCLRGKALRAVLGQDWLHAVEITGFPKLSSVAAQAALTAIKQAWQTTKTIYPHTPSSSKETKINVKINQLLMDPQIKVIFLKGSPGSGKTFTIRNQLKASVYNYPQELALCLKHQADEMPVLYLDEANLYQTGTLDHLKAFIKNRVFFNNEWQKPPENLTIIASGNPENFPHRHYHDFFRDYAITLYFHPKDAQSHKNQLLNNQLQPLLEFYPRDSVQKIAEDLLKIYEFIKQCNPRYLYSQRDLESLTSRFLHRLNPQEHYHQALFTAAQLEFSGNFIEEKTLKHFYDFLENICDEANIPRKPDKMVTYYQDPNTQKEYAFPAELGLLIEGIEEDLAMRQKLLQDGRPSYHKRGVLVEGEVGVGKSTLMRAILLKNKFTQASPNQTKFTPMEFVEINVRSPDHTGAASLQEMKNLILKVSRGGAILLLNELNLNNALDADLNQALDVQSNMNFNQPTATTGVFSKSHTSLFSNETKTHPAFRIFATQNSRLLKGRVGQSPALLNRLHVFYVQPFTENTLINIATHHKIPEPKLFVYAYLEQAKLYPTHANMRKFYKALDLAEQQLGLRPTPRNNQ